VQNLTGELQTLTGRFDEARFFSEKSSDELSTKIKDLEAAIEELKNSLPEVSAKETDVKKDEGAKQTDLPKEDKKEGTKQPEETKTEEGQTSAAKDIYMAGYQAFKDGKSQEARDKFTSVLNDYPNNEYADNARFWLAESYYKDGNYEDAILAYEELFKKNPNSDKIPGAMLKQGLAFYALKDNKTGQIILEKLIEKFPDSEQAKLARKKISSAVPPKKKK
jgi:tol-pal system protein YbgF